MGNLEEKRSHLEHQFRSTEDSEQEKETQDMIVIDGENCREYIENDEPRTPPKRKMDTITPTTTPEHKMRATDLFEGSRFYNISLSQRDVDLLSGKKELNDNSIDYWLKYLEESNRFSFLVRVFSSKVVLLPFCISGHWVLYAISY